MRYCTFRHGNRTAAGLVHGKFAVDLGQAFFKTFKRPYKFRDLLDFLQDDGPKRVSSLDLGALRDDRTVTIPLQDVQLRAPLLRPTKIICVGLNYRAHAEEQNKQPPASPMLFSKAPNIVIGPGDPIRIPTGVSEQVDYEVELAAVVGAPGYQIPRARAPEHVFGYTIVNDVTARDVQQKDRQFFRGKSMNTFCPMGPIVVTPDELDAANAPLSLKVNGEQRQNSNTNDMIFDLPALIEFASAAFPLEIGDVISTGTPGGVGVFMSPPRWLKKGDLVEAEIGGIGVLANPVE